MSTQPIEHTGYGYTQKQPRRHREDVDFPLGPESSNTRQENVATSRSAVRDRIRQLLADIPKDDGRLSFRDVADYRDRLEKDWDAVVSGDLASLGVDMDRTFRLMNDPVNGSVTANAEHPDAARINQYFITNKEMADDFDAVMQLGKLVDVAQRQLSPDEMEQSLSSEAMGWWYQQHMDTSALYTGGGIVFGMGSSVYKGLDIRV